jgi:D-alanyl-D-alanine endopeptidase (penicillin-binding protein 7)
VVKTVLLRRALALVIVPLWLASGSVVLLSAQARAATKTGTARKPTKPGSRGKAAASQRHASRGKHVFLERRVVAVKGGMPNVQALGALVLDDGGHEVYARNPDKERPIASISKLAATLAVVDRGLELDGLTTITKADIEVAKGGARSRLLEGLTLSNRDLLHSALMGSDNRAIPALGRAVKLSPSQLTAAMNGKVRELGLKNTRFHEPTGLSIENVSTPRETIAMLRAVMSHPVLGPITRRSEYDAHPVGKPPIHYINTDHPAARNNVQVLAGKTGYNDNARYCLVIATKVDGHMFFMSFLANEGKLTRFGDVARVADWIVTRRPKGPAPAAAPLPPGIAAPVAPETAVAAAPAPPVPAAPGAAPAPPTTVLPLGVAAPPLPAAAETAPPATTETLPVQALPPQSATP